MAIQKTKSYVLRRIPLRETSWILTCLTESFGKIKGVVKGVRKEKGKFKAACELFCHSDIVFYEKAKTNFHLITDFSIRDSHEKLRSNFTSLTFAGYFSELLDQLLEDHGAHPSIYTLFDKTLTLLEENVNSSELIARSFEIKLLSELGFLPHLTDCMGCESELSGSVYFSSRSGGVLCKACHTKSGGGFLISNGCLQAIRFLAEQKIEKVIQLKLGKQITSELEQVGRRFIENKVERQLKSVYFIHQVKKALTPSRAFTPA